MIVYIILHMHGLILLLGCVVEPSCTYYLQKHQGTVVKIKGRIVVINHCGTQYMSSVATSDGTKGCTHAHYHDGLTQPAAMFLTLELKFSSKLPYHFAWSCNSETIFITQSHVTSCSLRIDTHRHI